jgi:multidrug transporter EmrE-like cation transporter
MKLERPAGVTAVTIAFLLTAAYLLTVGLTMLARPGLISMAAGAELLGGLELAGPYMFLLTAAVGVAVALGLWRLHRWARWTAILIAMIGMVLLLPSVSSAVIDFRFARLVWGGLGVIVRAIIVWYLFQEPVGEMFVAK